MAFEYYYDFDNGLIELVGSGPVTSDDRKECVKRMLEDRTLPGKAKILINVSTVENPPSTGEVKFIDRLLKLLHARFDSRIAILNFKSEHVTASHVVAFWAGGNGKSVKAFSSEEQAREWLATDSI